MQDRRMPSSAANSATGQAVKNTRSPEEVRLRVLEAGRRCLEANGYQRVSMAAIAAEAKIGRATLYRHFANRDEVLQAVVIHETRRRLARIALEAKDEPDVGAAILAFIRLVLDVSSDAPVITVLLGSDALPFTQEVLVGSSVELFEIIADCLDVLVDGRERELRRGVTIDDAAEWTLRVVLSFFTVRSPRRRSASGLDSYLSRFLLPVIVADSGLEA